MRNFAEHRKIKYTTGKSFDYVSPQFVYCHLKELKIYAVDMDLKIDVYFKERSQKTSNSTYKRYGLSYEGVDNIEKEDKYITAKFYKYKNLYIRRGDYFEDPSLYKEYNMKATSTIVIAFPDLSGTITGDISFNMDYKSANDLTRRKY